MKALFRIALLLSVVLLTSFPHQLIAQPPSDWGKSSGRLTVEKMIRFDAFTGRFTPEWRVAGGVGLLSTFFKDKGHSLVLPLQFRLGYRFVPAFSLDFMAGYSRTENTLPYYQTRTYIPCENRFRILALRPTGHLRINYRAEAFGGLLLAYQHNTVTPLQAQEGKTRNPNIRPARGLFLTAFIGTRYLLTPTVGVFGEFSMGLSLATVGLNVRLIGR
jgi:hypothetical protein